jgi:hypothetical protein
MTRAEHVEGGVALLGEAAPVCNGERLGEAGDAREEVIFQGAYRAFRRISAMHVWWCVPDLTRTLDTNNCALISLNYGRLAKPSHNSGRLRDTAILR